jgi:inward rectifier potassium channel
LAKLPGNYPDQRAERNRDLGFGGSASESRARLLNRDGSFNIERRGVPFLKSLNVYHELLTMSWWKFNAIIVLLYLVINLVFASLYVLIGVEHLAGIDSRSMMARFMDAFFFSTQTFTTVGYGRINPIGFRANTLAALESLTGLLAFALATGMLYGRFSRPVAKILYSKVAVIAPYQGGTGFMFRTANERINQLIEVECIVNLSLLQSVNGKMVRQFYELELERSKVIFFHLSWTVVHPITESSPLFGMSEADLKKSDAEFFILVKGFDDSFSQTVHSRTSYKSEEVRHNAKFSKIISIAESGKAAVDLHRIHEIEPVELVA